MHNNDFLPFNHLLTPLTLTAYSVQGHRGAGAYPRQSKVQGWDILYFIYVHR